EKFSPDFSVSCSYWLQHIQCLRIICNASRKSVDGNLSSNCLATLFQGWQSSVCNSTDGRTDGRNFRPRLVSSHDFWDERYFVRLFGRLQVELKYDRCSL